MTPSASSDMLHCIRASGSHGNTSLACSGLCHGQSLVVLQKWAGALEESPQKAVPHHLFLRVPTGKDCAWNNLWEEGKINIYWASIFVRHCPAPGLAKIFCRRPDSTCFLTFTKPESHVTTTVSTLRGHSSSELSKIWTCPVWQLLYCTVRFKMFSLSFEFTFKVLFVWKVF